MDTVAGERALWYTPEADFSRGVEYDDEDVVERETWKRDKPIVWGVDPDTLFVVETVMVGGEASDWIDPGITVIRFMVHVEEAIL